MEKNALKGYPRPCDAPLAESDAKGVFSNPKNPLVPCDNLYRCPDSVYCRTAPILPPIEKDGKTIYSRFDRLISRGASPCCPFQPNPQVCLFLTCREQTGKSNKIPPLVNVHYVLPQNMNGVVDNMYNVAYKVGGQKTPFKIVPGSTQSCLVLKIA